MLKRLRPAAFSEIVEEQGQSCLVLVTRKDCTVCKKVHPKIEALAEEYSDKPFYEVDVNEQPGVLTKNHLKGVPQTLFYVNGAVKAVITGDAMEDEIADKVEELL